MPDEVSSVVDFPDFGLNRLHGFPSLPRIFKICAASAIGIVGLYGVFSESEFISSNDAVVSAYVLAVRTPIEGTLQGAPLTAGDVVQAGSVLGRVGNDLLDEEQLHNLRLKVDSAKATANALEKQQGSLRTLRSGLLARSAAYKQAVGTRLTQQVDAARLDVASQDAALQEVNAEVERDRKLAAWGVLSMAALEKTLASQASLTADVASGRSKLGALETERAAMGQGIMTEPGTGNDVSYSLQRADDVSLRIGENERDLEAAKAQEVESSLVLQQEVHRASLLKESELRAPVTGMIWKLHAINGEHLEAGGAVLSLVDCSREFVLVQVPQDRSSSIVLNGKAEIKLTGETEVRAGTVMTVSSDGQSDLDGKLAATPLHKSLGDVATVVIRLDPTVERRSAAACFVGRTARVRLTTTQTNLLSLWFSKWF